MKKELPVSEETRRGHWQMEDLTYDADGREVFHGLTRAESEEYLTLRDSKLHQSEKQTDRCLALHHVWFRARQAAIYAERHPQ